MQEMAYNNLNFDQIDGVLIGADEKKYYQNPYSYGYIEKAIIYYNDGQAEVIEFTDTSDARDFCNQMRSHNIEIDNHVYKMSQKIWKVAYKEATKGNDDSKVKKALATAGIVAGIGMMTTAGVLGYKLANKNEEEITQENDDLTDTQGYGFYKYDLSTFEGMEQYISEIPDSEQKANAINYLNILQNFNNEITLVDDTKQLGGLTVEQLIAIDAFSNSNVYTADDYVKNFGLYDFSNLNINFQQGSLVAGAYLANSEVDGTILANIFKDKSVKDFYLKALEYQQKILNAETSKESKQAVKDFENFMNDVAVDQASEEYIDFSMHPGMSFATSVIVNSLNYNNVKLSSKLFSDIIIIGDDEQQSKLDSICSNADTKLNDAKILISSMNSILASNQTIKIYNNSEIEKAKLENREPVLMVLDHSELDSLLTETLCDQEQINNLINQELVKTNQFVTSEDQQKILANGIEISRKLQNSTENKNSGKSKKQIEIEKQLEENGVAKITEKEVAITTPEQKQDLIESNPEAVVEAKRELNEKEGLIANETSEEKQQAENKINQDVASTYNEGVNYVNQVISYYEANGDVVGIPNELQNAYYNLGGSLFNTCKSTGIARYDVRTNPTVGGEITPLPGMEDVDINAGTNNQSNNVTTEVIAPDFAPEQQVENKTPNVNQNESQPSTDTSVNKTQNEVIAPDSAPEQQVENKTSDVNQNESQPSIGTSVNETPNEVIAPDFAPEQSETITPEPSNGEITVLPGLEDIDISDISAEPVLYSDDVITEADIDSYLNTEEGLQFLQDMTASETLTEETSSLTK